MKQKAKTTKTLSVTPEQAATTELSQDLRNSILIVSLIINLFFLSLWIALQITSQFDSSLVSFFLAR
jgi:hypothetical protein